MRLLLILLLASPLVAADPTPAKPVSITVKPHVVSWGHSVSFDDAGLATPDAWFDVEFSVHADRDIILGCPRINLTSASTDSGEQLVPQPPVIDWSQSSDDAVATSTCHVIFKQPLKPAKTLAISGTVAVAPPASLRYVDLLPLGKYLGSWVAVQGLAGGSVHAYRQDHAVWLQFSPALAEVFHGMQYADVLGTELEIVDWTASDDALAAYTNDVVVGDDGRISISYFDLGKATLVPFTCPHLPLDGRPIERTPTPDHCPSTAPSRPASQAPGDDSQGRSSEKF